MNSLFLIGPMGAGKSSVGPFLATRCGLPFYDSDWELARVMQMSIAELFRQVGEPRFREYEQKIIQELISRGPLVLATGGGAVLTPSNAALLSTGIVVLLQVSGAQQLQRLQQQPGQRPLFHDAQQLAALQTMRAPHYTGLADICVNTDHATPEEVAQHIWQKVQCYTKP